MQQESNSTPFYTDLKIIIPILVGILLLLAGLTGTAFCIRHSK